MTNYEQQRIIEIYGKDYDEFSIPAYLRLKEKKAQELNRKIFDKLVDKIWTKNK